MYDEVWSARNPHKILGAINPNDSEDVIFVSIKDGYIPVIHQFVNEYGNVVTVEGLCYLTLLRDTIWPVYRSTATRNGLWWM